MLYYLPMHILSKKALETFWLKHSVAKSPLEVWYRLVSTSRFDTFTDVKKTFNSADYFCPYTIFDVGGNNFRVITIIHYNRQKLYIREVLTHAEYDRWNKAHRRNKL
ncbi:hypothetical protein Rin_00012800 [Candidatus Regiella insecticola 5.15]|uniref:mRNA interferase HigB n=1 Tax=Candidatus Regiella insecticola 5.15 TaxID=1005043 RepID=G2GZQ3_9ENTR|nr:hypothetical protein Rin_00012800 [Candidatus Regiella insecticola 5.15]